MQILPYFQLTSQSAACRITTPLHSENVKLLKIYFYNNDIINPNIFLQTINQNQENICQNQKTTHFMLKESG
jgi:hypothetical protein